MRASSKNILNALRMHARGSVASDRTSDRSFALAPARLCFPVSWAADEHLSLGWFGGDMQTNSGRSDHCIASQGLSRIQYSGFRSLQTIL